MPPTPLIVDSHNDLLLELEHRRSEEEPFKRNRLPNLERGGVGLQICPVFGSELEALPELILRRNLLQIATHVEQRLAFRELGVVENAVAPECKLFEATATRFDIAAVTSMGDPLRPAILGAHRGTLAIGR